LRRSPELRSLIFPHGLPRFSARNARDIQFAKLLPALVAVRATSASGANASQLGLFLLGFCISEDRRVRLFREPDTTFAAIAKDEMMLLIFAARLL